MVTLRIGISGSWSNPQFQSNVIIFHQLEPLLYGLSRRWLRFQMKRAGDLRESDFKAASKRCTGKIFSRHRQDTRAGTRARREETLEKNASLPLVERVRTKDGCSIPNINTHIWGYSSSIVLAMLNRYDADCIAEIRHILLQIWRHPMPIWSHGRKTVDEPK